MDSSEESWNTDNPNKGEGLTEIKKENLAISIKRHKVLLDRLSKR